MQKPNSKKNRAKNSKEKAWQGWLKEQPCIYCDKPGPSIVDHVKGSTFRHFKILIGEVFCNSKCTECDHVVTIATRKHLFERYGMTDSDATLMQLKKFKEETNISFGDDVENAIADVYVVNEDLTDWMKLL